MPVLIDGNNLLYAALEIDPERPPSRSTLCLLLAQWARKTGEKVAIVFDGPPPNAAFLEQISVPGIAVRFSGVGVKADDVIERLINADSAARLLLVVSTDREVRRAARRRKAKTSRADDFWGEVLRELARPTSKPLEPPEKQTGLSPEQAEAWLRTLNWPEK
jgi:uncharacterized protein